MKKMILCVMMVCGMASYANAQEKGEMWLGGTVSAWASKTDGMPNQFSLRIVPEIGWQLSDNWGLGVQLGYVHDNVEAEGDNYKTNGFVIAPFARYSFLKGDLANLFFDITVGYGYEKMKDYDVKRNTLQAGLRPGVAVHVSDNISLIGKVGFLGYQYEKLGDTKTHSGGLNLDLSQVELGMIVRF